MLTMSLRDYYTVAALMVNQSERNIDINKV